MAFTLPFGFNRADGTTVLPSQTNGLVNGTAGTASPATSITKSGNAATVANAVEEDFDSPEIERAEQATAQHRFKTLYQSALNYLQVLGRGTFITDGFGNRWRILSSKMQALKGGMASLSVTSESISFDSPPDEFQCVPVELGVDIMKHPRYSWALLPYVSDQSSHITVGNTDVYYTQIKESIVKMIQSYKDSPTYPGASTWIGTVQGMVLAQIKNGKVDVNVPNPNFTTPADSSTKIPDPVYWDGQTSTLTGKPNCQYFTVSVPVNLASASDPIVIALAAAKEMLYKIWRGEDTPPVTGYEITWSQYYFAPVFLNPGNYVENPIGIIPAYFTDPTQTGTHTIFDYLTYWNPQSFAQNGQFGGQLDMSCLRKPDEVDYQRTWFKITSKWICSPVGHWDEDLLTRNNRPIVSTDYKFQA